MQKIFLILMFAAFVLGGACQTNQAQTETTKFDIESLSEAGKVAYQSLLKADRFEEGFVGYAATLSEYVKDFNMLLQEREADAAFKSLLREATIAGQLYALCGVYFTDYKYFQKSIESYKKSDESVETMNGCMMFTEKVSKTVESNSPNVAIINRSQTMEEWRETNKKSYELDIAHGGFPATFRWFANREKRKK